MDPSNVANNYQPNNAVPAEGSEIVRRVRIPESFVFGPSNRLTYSTMTAASGVPSFGNEAANGRGTLRDSYVNAVIVTFATPDGGGSVADLIVLRLAIRPNQTSRQASDIEIFLAPSSGPVVIPCFCAVFSVTCYAVNAAGSVYPTDVGNLTCVTFT